MIRKVKIHAEEIVSYDWEMELDDSASMAEQVYKILGQCPDYWGKAVTEDFNIKSIDVLPIKETLVEDR